MPRPTFAVRHPMSVVRRPLSLVAALAASAACAGGPPPSAAAPTPAAAVPAGGVRFPAAFSDSYVFLRATIGGRPALLLFDSGAGATVLAPDLIARLGLAERGRRLTFGLGATAPQARSYAGVTIRIGDDTLAVPTVLGWPDAELPTLGIERAVGVIGADLLRARVLEIDWLGGSVTAWDTSAAPRPADEDVVVPLDVVQSLPVLAVATHVGGRADTVPVVVDYGSSAALILDGSTDAARRIAPALRDVRTRRVVGVGGAVDGPEGRLDSVAVGRLHLRAPLAFVDTAGVRTVSLAGAQGLVGTELLRRFTVRLDYAHGRAIFRPTRRAATPFCRNASGVCFDRAAAGGLPRVVYVDQSSPAGRAGLVPGDVLLTLDGLAVLDLADRELDARLDLTGTTHVLEVRRGITAGAALPPDPPLPGRKEARRVARPPTTAVIRWRM